MKYVIIIPDGCADESQTELDGKTPLEAAVTPAMDQIAANGIVGRANHTPAHLPAGSSVANMSLLGYDPIKNYTGRAPLEAAAQGIELGEHDWCIRCNLVTVTEQTMTSFTAGHISSPDAKELLKTAQDNCTNSQMEFIPGVSYRNLLMFRGTPDNPAPFSNETRATPPHDLSDKSVAEDFPRGPGSNLLCDLMNQSTDWFSEHPVNHARQGNDQLTATNIWLWGLGQRPNLTAFSQLHGINGAMITAVDLLRGLAALIGWDRIEVPGATGYTDTDYAAKGKFAIEALEKYDLVCIHVEAPDESSHEGDLQKKITSIEEIDKSIVGPVLEHLQATGEEFRILVTPDHPTYLSTKTHTHGNVPFTICGTGISADQFEKYNETNAEASELEMLNGWELMPFFLK
ncbi:cofactor-independent phosphoglycerate mutase [Mariniblastus sp.]|nr:cofactor-independent phosphoglycerate mutase [bacterium]MDA7880101.1 cofactor-independent phosphoglycerate mutase [Mariniblastus sp.]MDA7901756.1 cofactor-independent phosphoglycerate mutase [bacterium]MDA7903495.1 cofactor-independent phosphoglycerate mutase [Mariniblastus sp.]MDA7910263.1 cofactor-independent phosphoglycerate mutase [bacterium]